MGGSGAGSGGNERGSEKLGGGRGSGVGLRFGGWESRWYRRLLCAGVVVGGVCIVCWGLVVELGVVEKE